MVVDDEINIVDLLATYLSINDFDVTKANDGYQCINKLKTEVPDLIILDVKMPRLDGWQVCQKLKNEERTKSIPVIILTAFAQDEDREKSISVGADDYVTKPFECFDLLARINKLIGPKGNS